MNIFKKTATVRTKKSVIISISLVSVLLLSSCSLLRTHKINIEQGNIINPANVSRLHVGMSETEVKDIMGEPLLTNLFTPGRVDYIYTFQKPYQRRQQTQVTCTFRQGHLSQIKQSG